MVQRCQPTTYKCHRSSFLLFCQKLPLASGLTVCSNHDQAFVYQQKTSMTSLPFVFLKVLPAMILEWHDTTKITIAITNSCSLKHAEKNISSQGLQNTRGHGKPRFSRLNRYKIDDQLMNIFPILTEIPPKSCKKAFFIYNTGKTVKRPLHCGLPLEGKCINPKKTHHVDLLTSTY